MSHARILKFGSKIDANKRHINKHYDFLITINKNYYMNLHDM